MTDTTDTVSPIDAVGALPENPSGEEQDVECWCAQAHAPGDPAPLQFSHADVGTD
jgi:hypothetical protein